MSSPSTPHDGPSAAPPSRRREVLDRVAGLLHGSPSQDLRSAVADAVRALGAEELEAVRRALEEAVDLEDRSVRGVLGRDGNVVPVHHYRACRSEDPESSWRFRPPSPPIRALRDAMMSRLLEAGGLRIEGASALARADAAGKRLLFISNHESVFDLAVLPQALSASGLRLLAERLTFFVNPKIFNTPFINFFICRPIGLIKVPQNPRIAANESVMEAEEIKRRAAHGFRVAGERLASGDSLVIYPEGLRSDGVLHRFARAYLDLLRPEALEQRGMGSGDVLLMPSAHRGVRGLEGLADTAPEVRMSFGEPVEPAVFFEALRGQPPGVAAHLAGSLVARLLPEDQRGVYGPDPEAYLDHPHFRLRLQPHTLADIRIATRLAEGI